MKARRCEHGVAVDCELCWWEQTIADDQASDSDWHEDDDE